MTPSLGQNRILRTLADLREGGSAAKEEEAQALSDRVLDL